MFQFTVWSLPGIVATLLALALLPRVWRQRGAPGGWPLSLLLIGAAWWSAGQVLGTLVTTVDAKFLAAGLQYPGVVTAPIAWLLFALRYSGSLPGLARHWPWLLLPPASSLLLAWTNPLHHWLWRSAESVIRGDFVGWEIHYGPGFVWHTAWSYTAVGLGTLLMLGAVLRSPWHRRRAGAVIAAPLVVLACNLFYHLPFTPAWFDATPLGFALAGALFTLALRGSVLDLVPLSREQIIRDLPDAIFVVARDGRVIDMNPAARSLVDKPPGDGIGRLLWDLLPVGREQLEHAGASRRPLDLVMRRNGADSAWRVNTSDLIDPRGEVVGRALMFHEHTDRWRVENELRAASAALTEANRELERLTTLDSLTRVPHRQAFLQQTEEEVARARRYGRDLSLLLIDLEDLADLDARHGAGLADQVLTGIARLLESLRRDGDLIGRTGAGEFALLLPEADAAGARALVRDIGHAIGRSRFRSEGEDDLRISIRTGLATLEPDLPHAEALLARASNRVTDPRVA
jgi:diguanylate cyclase (GGDEF)-like protein